MKLDKHMCYQALKTRDARFDGHFFTGVSSTGIFCRPICPAQTPLEKNCTFFDSADAALEKGYRPCLRCRPESAPNSPAWLGSEASVNRAVKLIQDGALDGADNLDDFAARLGLSARQLRRLFSQHLGVSPLKVAQTKRLLFAKKLVLETDLAITQIAFSSGFQSVRRFNDAYKNAFHFPPSAERQNRMCAPNPASLQLRLSYRPPNDWAGIIAFFKARQIDAVETAHADFYERTVQIEDQIGKIRSRPNEKSHHLILEIEGLDIKVLRPCVHLVRRVFDLDCDPRAIESHLSQDTALARLIQQRPGRRLVGAWSGFECAVRAIIGQQISVKAARTLLNRLVERCAPQTPFGAVFPGPKEIESGSLEGLGITGKRIDFLKELAQNWQDLDAAQPAQAQIEQLCQIKGIGPWSAHYIVMRNQSHPDVYPVKDLVLLRHLQKLGLAQTHMDVATCFEKYRPWRAYGALYLWGIDQE